MTYIKLGHPAEDAKEEVAKIRASSKTVDAPEEVDEGRTEENEILVDDE